MRCGKKAEKSGGEVWPRWQNVEDRGKGKSAQQKGPVFFQTERGKRRDW